MKLSRYSTDYQCFLESLRGARLQTGLTQVELAQLLTQPQSYVSKCESGERRLDILEVRAWIIALGGNPGAFMDSLDEALGRIASPCVVDADVNLDGTTEHRSDAAPNRTHSSSSRRTRTGSRRGS